MTTQLVRVAPTSARPPGPGRAPGAWGRVLAVTLAAAGGLHVAAALALHEGTLPTVFFWLSAAGQFGAAAWMAACLRNGRPQAAWWTALTMVGTVGLIGLYFVVHGTDLLAGVAGHHGEALAAHAVHGGTTADGDPLFDTDLHGLLGAATVAAETLAVIATAALLPAHWRKAGSRALLGSAALLWALWLAGLIG